MMTLIRIHIFRQMDSAHAAAAPAVTESLTDIWLKVLDVLAFPETAAELFSPKATSS